MKKVLFFALILLAAVSCKKKSSDSGDPSDPVSGDTRDIFVGTYELHIGGTASISTSNETISGMLPDSLSLDQMFDGPIALTIEKDPETNNQVIISSNIYNCKALVSGNNLVLESSTGTMDLDLGDVAGVTGFDVGSVPMTYTFVHKMATLSDGILTWHTDANASLSFSISVLTVDITADADMENTAYKEN